MDDPPEYIDTASQPEEVEDKTNFILVMGPTGAGKTSFINTVCGSDLKVGHGLRSCTSEIGHSSPFEVDGHKVILIDTPGFDDTSRPDSDILTEIALFLSGLYKKQQNILGLVYLHPISAPRMGGTAVRDIQMFQQLVGDDAARNVVILTTKWELIEPDLGDSREVELQNDPLFFQPLLDLHASMIRYTVQGNSDIALGVIKSMVEKNRPVTLQIQWEMVEAGRAVSETAAGMTLSRALAESLREAEEKYQSQMKELEDQQMRQQGMHLLEVQAAYERSHRERVAEFETRQRAMRVNVDNAEETDVGRGVVGLLTEILSFVGGGVRMLIGGGRIR